jgi:hypothetical protein
MTHYRLRAFIHKAAIVIDVASATALGFVLAALRWNPSASPLPPGISQVLRWSQENSPILLIFLFIGSYLSRLRHFLAPPTTFKKIHALLDELQKQIFKDENDLGEPLHTNRVTLFKRGWCWRLKRWPWSGWLIPVERSGHMTRKTKTVFRAPDNPSMLEGVAGLAWARKAIVVVRDLPDLSSANGVVENLQVPDIETYARHTLVHEEWVRERVRDRKMLGRSYCGIPVEVSGTLWGVIVVDSQHPEPKAGQHHDFTYRLIAGVLGKLLEGG